MECSPLVLDATVCYFSGTISIEIFGGIDLACNTTCQYRNDFPCQIFHVDAGILYVGIDDT